MILSNFFLSFLHKKNSRMNIHVQNILYMIQNIFAHLSLPTCLIIALDLELVSTFKTELLFT